MTSKVRLPLGSIAAAWLRHATLEEMLTHELLFGLKSASPLQRAICRVAEGRPLGDLATHPHVTESLGGVIPQERPHEVSCVAGIRTYKSGMAACMGTHAALRCDASGLQPGEQLRVSIVSTKLENAKAVYQHLAGAWKASPLLRTMLVTDPANASDRFTIRRPDGVLCEFLTVAGSRAGSALVSFWQAAVIFDEYARMTGDAAEGVINWKEQRKAVVHRIRQGGYLVNISSPWAPFGPAYDHITKDLGKPSPRIVVFRARADHMNPVYWTPERCADAERNDPEAYKTDVLAQFTSGEESFFHGDHVEACLRPSDADEPYVRGATYTAAMDPATRGNGWSFAIFTRDGKTRRMVAARQWVGSRAEPLDPDRVLAEVAALCRAYHVESVDTDQWSGDALNTIAQRNGIRLHAWTHTDKQRTERYLHVRTMLAMGEVSMPRVEDLRRDLVNVKKKVTASSTTVVLPLTTDGRHCDWAPTVVAGLCRYLDDVVPEPRELTQDEWAMRETQRMRERAERSLRRDDDDD